jgi:hypothetical protein
VGHDAKVNNYRRELVPQGIRYEASVTVRPPGIIQEVSMTTWAGTTITDKRRPVVIEFPDEEGRTIAAEVWSTSLLGELRELGEKLSDRCRWKSAQAVWFVLTGEAPKVIALQTTRTFWSCMYHHDTLLTAAQRSKGDDPRRSRRPLAVEGVAPCRMGPKSTLRQHSPMSPGCREEGSVGKGES